MKENIKWSDIQGIGVAEREQRGKVQKKYLNNNGSILS